LSATKKSRGGSGVSFRVSTSSRPDFDQALAIYAFDSRGNLLERSAVKSGKVSLSLSAATVLHADVYVAPVGEHRETEPTPRVLERRGAFRPVLREQESGGLVSIIEIPGRIIDLWPWCVCFVQGQVLRAADGRAVCDARVHICEVDRLPWWIRKLPDLEVLRLRDDLLDVMRKPPIKLPPRPIPRPFPPEPDPVPFRSSLFRFTGDVALNPQPEVPSLPVRVDQPAIDAAFEQQLLSQSVPLVRETLALNWRFILPWLCYWPWWWWRFRCDEMAVVTTDANGRFQVPIWYQCSGDKPDLYFWVEYDLGSGFETVHRPLLACNTYWDYACGTDVTIRVADPRVPACSDEPDLPGCQVVVRSIGNTVAIRELQANSADAAHEGLTTGGRPFGGTLEFRVDFSRTELIDNKGIPYYRWSYRRLSGPDGVTTTVDPAAEPVANAADPNDGWKILTRSVYRHYRVGASYPSDQMGPTPMPPAPDVNLFRIKPADPPVGNEWIDLNPHVDLATAYFETAGLPGAATGEPQEVPVPAPAADDLAAGRYELKLELFDAAGNLVNWTDEGIDLRITDQDAPFGTGLVTTSSAPPYNRILDSGKTVGFRMVLRVDNNHCFAQVLPVAGALVPDPTCGFHEYGSLTDQAALSFVARHPNNFASYWFDTVRGVGTPVGAASTSGTAGEAGNNGFVNGGAFTYAKNVSVGALLDTCPSAAFAEQLRVEPWAQNGYTTLSHLRHTDLAAFALAAPCPPCEGEDPGTGAGSG